VGREELGGKGQPPIEVQRGRQRGGRGRGRVLSLLLAVALAAASLVGASGPAQAATPTLTTQASPSGFPIGTAIFDVATLAGGQNPTGTITFNLFGPNNTTCSGPPIFTSTKPVAGNGNYQSDSFTTTQAGDYQWVASYSGDANNAPVTTACNDPAEMTSIGKAVPTLATQASAPVATGNAIFDTATLSNAVNPTGTITFTLYGPNNLVCAPPPIFTSTVPVNGNGTYTSDPFIPTAPGTYIWQAIYSGDANNFPANTICADPLEAVLVTGGLTTPTLTTQASPGVPLGGQISDQANLTNGVTPTGTITFSLFGPNNATCSGPPIFTSTKPVTGNGVYTSDPFTPTAPGTYRWVAAYSGDLLNNAVTTACNDPSETVTVAGGPPVPTLTTTASPAVPLGGQLTDTANLSGGNNPTGTITFTLFGPNDTPCGGPPPFSSTKPVSGNGTYTSDPFTVTQPGTYRWVASYSGDANNGPVTTACGDPAETVTVAAGPTPVTLTTTASPSVALGGQVFDTATINGNNPTGTITFNLFGPDNPTCGGTPAFTNSKPVSGNGSVTSDLFMPTAPGTYRWVASYSGDANNLAATTACGDPAETVVVTGQPPVPVTLTTQASPRVPLGGPISDTATLGGGNNPTGTIAFDLFGPDNATCSGAPVFTSTKPVAGAGTYTSDPFTPTAPGTYRWVARYSGDVNNLAATTGCNDPAEHVVVGVAVPSLITQASTPSAPQLTGISDTATLAGGNNPTGTITFSIFYNNPTCAGTPPFSASVPVSGNGNYTSPTINPSLTGTYQWVATYSGDANNSPVATACGDPAETTVITAAVPGTLTVTKTANPTSLTAPGGTVIFTVGVTNSGGLPVALTGMVDDVHGDLTTRPGSTCTTAPGTILHPGGSYTCSFSATVTGSPGATQTDTVTVGAFDALSTPTSASATATVAITAPVPQIMVDKTASPATLPEPGGTFTFGVVVTNTSAAPLVLTGLSDNVHGNLSGRGTCALGATLAASGGTYSCSFTASFTGNAGARQTDTVTATAQNEFGGVATASDSATVSLTDVLPQISLTHTVSPPSLPEPGGAFTHTVVVTNTGAEPVTLGTLTDNVYGNLAARPDSTCGTGPGTVLAPGASYTCTFTVTFTGEGRATLTDTVTVTASDDEQHVTSAAASATVSLSDVPPRVEVDLVVSPQSRPEPGGTFTYTVTVRNVSNPENVTLVRLVSNVHGDLNGRGTCAVPQFLPAPPAPGSSYTCSFTDVFLGNAGARQVVRVTATVVDNEGTEASATSPELSGTVIISDVAPQAAVDKTVVLDRLPAPGGTFIFTVRVTNTGSEQVVITSLVDDVYGDLAGHGCGPGAVLGPGDVFACSFVGLFFGAPGATQTDVVTVTVTDDEGNAVRVQDSATVTIDNVLLLGGPGAPNNPGGSVVPVAVTPSPALVAFTGSRASGLARVAAFLLLAGLMLVGASRRRARHRPVWAGDGQPLRDARLARLSLFGGHRRSRKSTSTPSDAIGGMGLGGREA
jgi:hypothetical protein